MGAIGDQYPKAEWHIEYNEVRLNHGSGINICIIDTGVDDDSPAGCLPSGAMGGVICNPKELSPTELERLSRGYVRTLGAALGPQTDVPEPGMYTTPQVMAWMADEAAVLAGEYRLPTF